MTIEMTTDDARVVVDPTDGCRLTSFQVRGLELLASARAESWGYGCFVMAPWAGRLRNGHARWGTVERTYPTLEDGHALHGLVHAQPWTQVADDTWEIQVDDRWLAPCRVLQRIALTSEALHLDLEVQTDVEVPATVGWHPWFRRELDTGAPVSLDVRAAWMLEKEADGSTSQRRIDVQPGPWDDTFGGIDWPVRLTWPGALTLEVDSDAPVAVVYDAWPTAVCVEPQSGAPNEVNLRPRVATAEAPITLSSTWRWRPDDGPADPNRS